MPAHPCLGKCVGPDQLGESVVKCELCCNAWKKRYHVRPDNDFSHGIETKGRASLVAKRNACVAQNLHKAKWYRSYSRFAHFSGSHEPMLRMGAPKCAKSDSGEAHLGVEN